MRTFCSRFVPQGPCQRTDVSAHSPTLSPRSAPQRTRAHARLRGETYGETLFVAQPTTYSYRSAADYQSAGPSILIRAPCPRLSTTYRCSMHLGPSTWRRLANSDSVAARRRRPAPGRGPPCRSTLSASKPAPFRRFPFSRGQGHWTELQSTRSNAGSMTHGLPLALIRLSALIRLPSKTMCVGWQESLWSIRSIRSVVLLAVM